MPTEDIVLASASIVRRRLLENAGIRHAVDAAHIDESIIKAEELKKGAVPETIASRLAHEKAEAVARRHPGRIVLGADQVLVLNGRLYDKPGDVAEARRHLQDFRGRDHVLISAWTLVRDGRVLAAGAETVRLYMHRFSDGFLDAYLATEGENILSSVGCYRVEGRGLQLFERIEGDYFTVLGLPMLPLLAALRNEGILAP